MLCMPALRADIEAHVFHDANDGHRHLLKHLEALARVHQGHLLRCGDDHRTRDGHILGEGEVDVTRARRHVDEKVIQIFPCGLAQELVERLRDHGSTPDHGLVLVDEKPNGIAL